MNEARDRLLSLDVALLQQSATEERVREKGAELRAAEQRNTMAAREHAIAEEELNVRGWRD